MRLNLLGFGLVASFGLVAQVEAAGYGSAGCGLGSLVFDPDESFTQVFAATTNGTFGSQTFGITSGTSNCETAGKAAVDVERFMAGNRNALENDVARGSGEALTAFSQMLGCKDSSSLGSNLKQNYGKVFAQGSSDAEVSSTLIDSIKSDSEVVASCGSIG